MRTLPSFRVLSRKLRACGAGLLLASASLWSATIEDTNTWVSVSVTGRLGEREQPTNHWRYSFDTHNKFGDNSRKYSQGTWRVGIGYTLDAHWSVWAGYSYAHTDLPFTTTPYYEHRTFQQILWTDRAGEFTLSSRHRLEVRFPDSGDDMGLRSRHQFRVSHPLGAIKPLSWAVWDEVIFNLNETDYGARRGLDQNRAFGGLGWKLSESMRSEAGYMHNFNRRPGRDNRVNHVLALSLVLAFK